jgi:FkbM family methyltransferase
MKNILSKIIKYFPRKIKRKFVALISTEVNNKLENMKSEFNITFTTIRNESNNSLLRYLNFNKLLLKNISETISGVEFIGQELQDMYAFLYFKGKKNGFFVDIGAYNGITISNTYSLEKIGWKGICVEPVSETFNDLIKNRKCMCVNAAIYNEDGKTLDFIQTKGGRSGFTKDMTDSMIKAAEQEGIVAKYSIKTITFEKLMENNKISNIDFMSIDVEGAELAVLESIDFNKYKFDLITIENNQGIEKLRDYMFSKGYKILFDIGVDILFIPKNVEIGMYWWTDQ